MTVNQWHYFGLAGWIGTRLGMSEWMLSSVREAGAISDYHVPTEYRMNTTRGLSRRLAKAGFASVEFRMWDLPPDVPALPPATGPRDRGRLARGGLPGRCP